MKVNLVAELKSLDGSAIVGTDGNPAVLKGVIVDALMAVFQDEPNLSGEEKMKRFLLAEKVYNGVGEYSAEEVALMKKLIGKAYTPIIVGQAWKILEGE